MTISLPAVAQGGVTAGVYLSETEERLTDAAATASPSLDASADAALGTADGTVAGADAEVRAHCLLGLLCAGDDADGTGDGADRDDAAGDDAAGDASPEPRRDPVLVALDVQAAALRAACALRAEAAVAVAVGALGTATGADALVSSERDCESEVRDLYAEHYAAQARAGFAERIGGIDLDLDLAAQRADFRGSYLSVAVAPSEGALSAASCRGPLFLDRVTVEGSPGQLHAEVGPLGTSMRILDDAGHLLLTLHDNPRCLVTADGSDAPLLLDLPDHVRCAADAGGLACDAGDGSELFVLLHGRSAAPDDGNVLRIDGRATLMVNERAGDARDAVDAADAADDGDGTRASAAAGPADLSLSAVLGAPFQAALRADRIGAEVLVAARGASAVVDAAPLGDLQIDVEAQPDEVTAYVESEAGVGKTVALAVDAALFRHDDLAVRAWAVADDGSEVRMESRPADSLEDALDPLDDGEAVEFWIVEDDAGLHVLASIPHFSMKRLALVPADAPDEDGGNPLETADPPERMDGGSSAATRKVGAPAPAAWVLVLATVAAAAIIRRR